MKKPITRKISQWILFGIITLSTIFHFVYLWQLKQTPYISHPLVDANIYHQKALNILESGWLGERIFFQAPLYPYFLATIYKLFGPNIEAVNWIQAVSSVFSIYLIYLIAQRLFDTEIGILSAGLALFYGVFVFYTGFLLKASLSILFTCLFLLILLEANDSKTFTRFLLTGLFLGICITLRGNFLLVFVGLLPWIYFGSKNPKSKIRNLLGFVLGTAIIISPITFRNYYLENDFVLINYDAGPSFFIGNNPHSTGLYESFGFLRAHPKYERTDMTIKAEKIMGHSLKPSEVSRFWFGISFRYIQEKPLHWLGLQWNKFLILINNYEKSDNYHFGFMKNITPVLHVGFISFGGILVLSLTGIAMGRWKSSSHCLFYLFIFLYSSSVVMFYINSRYRLPLLPALIPFAAWMIIKGIHRIFLSSLNERTAIICFALIIIFGTFRDIGRRDISTAHLNYGNILRMEGKFIQAEKQYHIALKLDPNEPSIYFNLAGFEQQKGNQDKAVQFYKQALQFPPLRGKIHNNLGIIFMNQGKWRAAEKEFLKAIKLQPNEAEPLRHLASIYLLQKDKELANRMIQLALRLEAQIKKP